MTDALQIASSMIDQIDREGVRYNCECQVGGVDAVSIDTDWLLARLRDIRGALVARPVLSGKGTTDGKPVASFHRAWYGWRCEISGSSFWVGSLKRAVRKGEQIMAATNARNAEVWDEALRHVWRLSDPAETITIYPTRELLTEYDVQQALRENPYKAER